MLLARCALLKAERSGGNALSDKTSIFESFHRSIVHKFVNLSRKNPVTLNEIPDVERVFLTRSLWNYTVFRVTSRLRRNRYAFKFYYLLRLSMNMHAEAQICAKQVRVWNATTRERKQRIRPMEMHFFLFPSDCH